MAFPRLATAVVGLRKWEQLSTPIISAQDWSNATSLKLLIQLPLIRNSSGPLDINGPSTLANRATLPSARSHSHSPGFSLLTNQIFQIVRGANSFRSSNVLSMDPSSLFSRAIFPLLPSLPADSDPDRAHTYDVRSIRSIMTFIPSDHRAQLGTLNLLDISRRMTSGNVFRYYRPDPKRYPPAAAEPSWRPVGDACGSRTAEHSTPAARRCEQHASGGDGG